MERINNRVDIDISENLEKVSQRFLLNNNIDYSEFSILSEIYKSKDRVVSVNYIYRRFPVLFSSKKVVRTYMKALVDKNLLEIDRDVDLFTQTTDAYRMTSVAISLISNKDYKPKYSSEEFTKAMQVINHWNSFDTLSTHSVHPYGEVQTKTIEHSISYISDLLKNTDVSWFENPPRNSFTITDINSVIDKYVLKFETKYLPEDKGSLSKSLSNFFCQYKTARSEFFNTLIYGLKENKTTADILMDIGISTTTLKKAYHVLSATGSATNKEKLEIQKSILFCHKRFLSHIEGELDVLYSWRKVYRENVATFNIFLFKFLEYIEREIGLGRAKPQYISFRRGSKVLEGYAKEIADAHSIILFPNKSQTEKILKSKIVK